MLSPLGAQKVVSLSPVITQVLECMEAQEHILGCTSFCTCPEAVCVGGLIQPSLEAIISLGPDLVLASDLTSGSTLSALAHLGIPVEVYDCATLKGFYTLIDACVLHFNKNSFWALDTKQLWANTLRPSGPAEKTLRILFLYDPVQLYSCSEGSYIYEMIVALGADPCTEGLKNTWPKLSYEYVLCEDPDWLIILVNNESECLDTLIREHPKLKALKAVQKGQVRYVSPKGCFTMGEDSLELANQIKSIIDSSYAYP